MQELIPIKSLYRNKMKALIALDYDPTAQKVAETGFSIAKSLGAEVVLLHVISDPAYYSSTEHLKIMGFAGHMDTSSLQLDNIEGLEKTAQQFLDKLKQHLGDKTLQILVKEGDSAGSILKTAKEIHADVIVMGSHSRRWMEKIIMGSVTEKVMSSTKIPLLIIPTKKGK